MSEDPLAMTVSPRWARRFRLAVHVLLVLSIVALALSLWHYVSVHDGLRFHLDDDRALAPLMVSVITFLSFVALEVARPFSGELLPGGIRRKLGVVSGVVSLFCLAGIALSWVVIYSQGAERGLMGDVVRTPAQAESYLGKHLPKKGTGFQRIPTGLFIQSIEFEGTNDVILSGYVWQKYPASMKTAPGVVFPEAGDAYAAKSVYKTTENGTTVEGWYIEGTFRQIFDYASYPLDKQNVWIRMWAKDFFSNVVLTPDFSSYPPWRPHDLTGLDSQLVYGDWNPDFTDYTYVNNSYSSTFGYPGGTGISGSSTPEMYFNIGLKRDPQGPLYGQLIRWLFIALIVFGALFLITVDEEQREVVGFTTFEVMSFAVGMLLVIVFDQNAVREATGARGVVYLEYFSYALYFLILLVGVNAMLLTAKVRVRALSWGGNLMPKLLYWPVLLGLVLVATVLTFF